MHCTGTLVHREQTVRLSSTVRPWCSAGGGEGSLPFLEEADVFTLLGLDYVAPADRSV